MIAFYSIKLMLISHLVFQTLYFQYLGIGTYDYILEKRQLTKLKEKVKNKEIN